MLLAKDFKTAVAVVIAVAGLLGFGTANATVYLGEDGDAVMGSNPVYFAAELYPGILPASPSKEGGIPTATSSGNMDSRPYSALVEVAKLDSDGTGGVDVALLSDERYYVRFDLTGGANFGTYTDDPLVRRFVTTNVRHTNTTRVRGGRDDDTSGIWTFTVGDGTDTDDADPAAVGDTEVDIELAAGAWTIHIFGLDQAIRFPRALSATTRTCTTMEFRLYDNVVDARSKNEPITMASGPFMCFVPTLSASVTAPQTLTASVADGFRRFKNPDGGDALTSGRLATANVAVAKTVGTIPIQNPADGMSFADDDVLKNVEFSLTGTFTHSSPFGFGEFKLGSTTMTRLDAAGDEITAEANKTAEGKASTAKVMATMESAGSVAITVDVSGNNASSATNVYEAIGAGSYKAALEIDQVDPGTGRGSEQNPAGKSDMAAGTINRDGTTVRIGYLQTITELERDGDIIGWNQRLVVTNHGSISADVMLSDFNAEGGAEVACKEPAGNNVVDGEGRWECGENGEVMTTIDANSQLVLKVADLIAGASRTSAMVTIAQDSSQISVASTHVTLPGGQTDTVLYWPLQ